MVQQGTISDCHVPPCTVRSADGNVAGAGGGGGKASGAAETGTGSAAERESPIAPIGIQTAHLPVARVPGLLEEARDIVSLYETLRSRYGIAPVEAHEVYRVGLVAEEDAELIQLPAGTPAFVVQRIGLDANGPFEFTLSTMRADRYEIRSTLYI